MPRQVFVGVFVKKPSLKQAVVEAVFGKTVTDFDDPTHKFTAVHKSGNTRRSEGKWSRLFNARVADTTTAMNESKFKEKGETEG